MDVETKTLKELRAETERLLAAAFKKGIGPVGDKRKREYYVDFLSRCHRRGLSVFPTSPGAIEPATETSPGESALSQNRGTKPAQSSSEDSPGAIEPAAEIPPASIPEELLDVCQLWETNTCNCPACGGTDTFENYDAGTTHTEPPRAEKRASDAQLPAGRDDRAQHDGTDGNTADKGLGSQKGDRVPVEVRIDSRSSRRLLPYRSTELTAQQAPNNIAIAFNDEQRPPDRGGGRYPGLAIGMGVGHRNPANYYWLNAAHKSQAAALEKLGWGFTPNAEIDGELSFLQKYKDWEFYSVAGEPLLVANLKGASFAIALQSIAGCWNKEIDKAKRAIGAAKLVEPPAPKQLNFLDLLAV